MIDAPDLTLPRSVSSIALLVALAMESGMEPARVLAGTGLAPADLADPDARVDGLQELQVIANLVDAGHGRDFALRAGDRYRVNALGLLGYLLMNCATVRDAFDTARRYLALTSSYCTVEIREAGEEAMLVLYTGLPPSAVRDFVVARDAAAIARMYADVAGGPPPLRRLWFAAGPDEPPIHIDARDGDQVVVMALFERAALDAPLPLANTLARRQSERLCEERLAGLQARAGFDGRIRAALARQPGDMPSLESLAERLHMTPRTLRRRLAERGTTYRRLVEEVRRDLACALLHDPELPIQTVAVRLGYEDPASFTTAFRRWVGSSPAQYRRNAGKPS